MKSFLRSNENTPNWRIVFFVVKALVWLPNDLVARVTKTFSVYPWRKLDSCWAVLHEHYRSIRMCEGGNKYCDPHCGIRRRVAKGLDPVNYSIHFDDGYDTDDEDEA